MFNCCLFPFANDFLVVMFSAPAHVKVRSIGIMLKTEDKNNGYVRRRGKGSLHESAPVEEFFSCCVCVVLCTGVSDLYMNFELRTPPWSRRFCCPLTQTVVVR